MYNFNNKSQCDKNVLYNNLWGKNTPISFSFYVTW